LAFAVDHTEQNMLHWLYLLP